MEAEVEIQEVSIVQPEGVPQRFSYSELSEATGGFSEESILGHGGFGVVYRGELKSGTKVAIRRMNPEAIQSRGMKEFKSEAEFISQVRHRNIVKLKGHCADGDRKEYMLVYDLMPNGSLDDALFRGTIPLSWPQKLKILTGAAIGLGYLHQGLKQQVTHRNVKCSNILLDKEWNAKLGDFGIARMVPHQRRAKTLMRSRTTALAEIQGYIAPEVFSGNQFTDKADVYAFGVVVLEVACGRRVLPSPSHRMGLIQWVSFAHSKGSLLSIMDERHCDDDTEQVERVLKVGLLCAQSNPQDRPSMGSVVQMLAGNVIVPPMPTSKPSMLKRLLSKMISPSKAPLTVSPESILKSSASATTANMVSRGLEARSLPNMGVGSPVQSPARGTGSKSVVWAHAYMGAVGGVAGIGHNGMVRPRYDGAGAGQDPALTQSDGESPMSISSTRREYGRLENGKTEGRKFRSKQKNGEGRTEIEWGEQYEPGVYVTLADLPGGGKHLKRVWFSRKRFSEKQAEQWWANNEQRVHKEYDVRLADKQTSGVPGSSRPGHEDRGRLSAASLPSTSECSSPLFASSLQTTTPKTSN